MTVTDEIVDTGIYLAEVINVTPVRHYVLDLVFSDDTRKRVNIKDLLGGCLDRLHDEIEFNKATIGLGTVVWPGEPFDLDIAPETLYEMPESD